MAAAPHSIDYISHDLLEAMGDCIWTWDIASGAVHFSEGWARAMGFDEGELDSYRKWTSLIHKEDLEQVRAAISACIDGENRVFDCELRLRNRADVFVWVRSRALVTAYDADGRAKTMFGIYENIDRRKQTEQALKDAEMRWSFALEGAGDGVWDWNIAGGEIYFSPQCKAMLGHSDPEFKNDLGEWCRVTNPRGLADANRKLKACLDGETDEYVTECRARRKDGSIIWILDRGKIVSYDAAGKPTRMIGTHQDITEQKFQTAALERSQKQLERITSLVPGMVYEFEQRLDGTASFPYASPGIERLFQISASDAQQDAEAVFSMIAEEDRERVKASLLNAAKKGHDWKEEYRVESSHGETRWLMGHAALSEGHGNSVTRWYGHIADITELKRASQQLQRQALELHATNRELEEFANIASHDLQEPLRKIQAYGDRLARKTRGCMPESEQVDLAKIMSSAKRMRGLIDALLDLARVTFDMAEFEDIALEDVFDEAISDLEIAMLEVDASISAGALPVVRGNRTLLCRLVENLVNNALKFRRQNSQPLITVSATEVVANESSSSNRISISVSDNGIGIDSEHAERVFKPLQRLHARDAYEGTGIGLAVCRKIVAAHGGEISVTKNDYGGAVFSFDLELAS